MLITKLKGTNDLIGIEAYKYRFIQKKANEITKLYGIEEMITPIFEKTELFLRGVGETTDIVNKEMYSFQDKGGRDLTLRPEGTAAVSRAFVENKLYALPGLKKYSYFGPMFRYERPQAGRMRQFSQFGVEFLGNGSPYMDSEVISLASKFLKSLGINKFKVVINTIGNKESRSIYSNKLREYFAEHILEMCADCKSRLEKNPLRILDCKVDSKNAAICNAPSILDFLTQDDIVYFDKVKSSLEALDIKYEISNRLVRGLDYYTSTVFELIYDDPSSKIDGLTLLAGGRYNGLSSEIGGPDVEAIGFAAGIERLILVLDELHQFDNLNSACDVCIISIGEEQKNHCLKLADKLRDKGLYVEIDYVSFNLKPQFKLADRTNAKIIMIIGEEELVSGKVIVKNKIKNIEEVILESEIYNYIKGE